MVPFGRWHIRRMLALAGPGYLVAVGYMDPGNWVSGLAAGSGFGYRLLCVIGIANAMAICLQYSALKLGMVTGYDLATLCRREYTVWVSRMLWVFAEIAMMATDLAEVIGSAIGLQLLFGIPVFMGVIITSFDVIAVLALTYGRQSLLEKIVAALIGLIAVCFAIIVHLVRPDWAAVCRGFIPSMDIITHPDMLYIAVGMIGATVMPHNLYLHSGLVAQGVRPGSGPASDSEQAERIWYGTWNMIIALSIALCINAALVIIAAAVFYERGITQVAEIEQAYYLFTPLMNSAWASVLFAIALLAAGQNSTITGTLAGQMVMDGFLQVSWPAWKRRLFGRVLTITPALIAIGWYGPQALSRLLMASQIVLSFQLPFAVIPLLLMTGSRALMGRFAHGMCMKMTNWAIAVIIIGLNVLLLASV